MPGKIKMGKGPKKPDNLMPLPVMKPGKRVVDNRPSNEIVVRKANQLTVRPGGPMTDSRRKPKPKRGM